MAFIFNTANNNIISGSLDIFNGIFDLYLVSNIPNPNNTIVSDISIISGTTNTQLTNNFSSTIWKFVDIVIPNFTYNIVPVGFVVSKRSSAVANNNDPVIYYSEFTNSLGQIITYTIGLYRIYVNFDTNGLISFDSTYEYFSGAFANTETIPKGLIHLLGSNNNTVVYTNPTPTKLNTYYRNQSGSLSAFGDTSFTNRTNTGTVTVRWVMLNFSKLIRVGTCGILTGTGSSGTLTLFGSNTLTAFDLTNLNDVGRWTTLGTLVAPTANSWNFVTSTNLTYWKYLKFEMTGTDLQYSEIEFYNSSMISSTINLV
jgi:hypothetical protein